MKRFNLDIIRRHAAASGMSLGNAEKDYALSVVLVTLAKTELGSELVFKGGTCLKKAYFADYRFSSDLDFTALSPEKEAHKQQLVELFEGRRIEGLEFLEAKDQTQAGQPSLNLRLKYHSALASPARPHIDSIRLDVNYQALVLAPPEERTLRLPEVYQLPTTRLKILQLKEIAAEKVHAIYKRPKPRDLYDLHYLLAEGVEFDLKLIDLKLESLALAFDPATFQKKVERLEPRWSRDMEGLLANPPDYAKVAATVLAHVEDAT